MLKFAIPLLHISNASAAESFFCNQLGFRREFAHCGGEGGSDPCYVGLTRDGVWLHLSSFSGDGIAGGVVNLIVDDVDALHAELAAKGVGIDVGPDGSRIGKDKSKDEIQGFFPFASLKGQDDDFKHWTGSEGLPSPRRQGGYNIRDDSYG